VRDLQGIVFAIEGINFTASIVTLVTLRQYAPNLVAAIRRWRLNQSKGAVVLTVKGGGLDMRVDLPPNVSTRELLQQLSPLLDEH